MEPVSAVASVVTLLEAGGFISRKLKQLAQLRKDDVLSALNNEIEDLRLVVEEVSDIVGSADDAGHAPRSLALQRAIQTVKDALLDLQRFLAYDVTTFTAAQARLDKSVYLRTTEKLQRLKDRIRNAKLDLSLTLQTFSVYE